MLQRTYEKSLITEEDIETQEVVEISHDEKRIELIEKIEKSIKEIQKYKVNFQFKEAKLKIDELIESIKSEDFPEFNKKLKKLKEETHAAEIKFNKLYPKLVELIEKLKKNQKSKLLDAALKNCEEIIQLSHEIGIHEIESEYKLILEQIKKDLFEEIKKIINKLRKEGLNSLNKGNLIGALENYNKIVKNLFKFIN